MKSGRHRPQPTVRQAMARRSVEQSQASPVRTTKPIADTAGSGIGGSNTEAIRSPRMTTLLATARYLRRTIPKSQALVLDSSRMGTLVYLTVSAEPEYV